MRKIFTNMTNHSNKLPKGTFKNIEFSELKNLVAHCHQSAITTNAIRDMVECIIKSPGDCYKDNTPKLESIQFFLELGGVDFDEPINKNRKPQKDKSPVTEIQNRFFSYFTNTENIQDLLYVFDIKTDKDFLEFYIKKGLGLELLLDDNTIQAPQKLFSIIKDFIKNNDDRKVFLDAFDNNEEFRSDMQYLTNIEFITQKMKKDIDELLFIFDGDEHHNPLIAFFKTPFGEEAKIHQKNLKHINTYLPFVNKNGQIDRNHHFFIEKEGFLIFWNLPNETTKHLISLYNAKSPEEIAELYKVFYQSHTSDAKKLIQSIDSRFFGALDNLQKSQQIEQSKLIKFLQDNILNNKDNSRTLGSIKDFYSHEQFDDIIGFFLKNKQKSLMGFLQKMKEFEQIKKDFELDFDIKHFVFIPDSNIEEIIQTEEKINAIIPMNKKEKNRWNNALRTKQWETIQKISTERRIQYFYKISEQELQKKINHDFGVLVDNNEARINRPEFLEAYKMSIHPRNNKTQFKNILDQYLAGDFDNVSEMNQLKTPKNQQWLNANLTQKQQKIWLSKNRKEYIVPTSTNNENTIKNERQQHHIRVINDKIGEINTLGFDFKTNIQKWHLLHSYFLDHINPLQETIIQKGGQVAFDDILFQFESILQLNAQKQSAPKADNQYQKVIIEREQDPLRAIMMGNWVQGSCLSFYSSVGNYWSTIANTIDANKAVFYLYNEKGEVLGRVLGTIGDDKKLSRYHLYYAKSQNQELNNFVDTYFIELGKELGLKLNGNQDDVKVIEADAWYKDGICPIDTHS